MKNNFLDSTKREHGVMGYESGASQYVAPFDYDKKWFVRGYSQLYTIADFRFSIRHCYMFSNKSRWVVVSKWRDDRSYVIEIYDSIEINGDFYNKTVYGATADSLKMAVHLANIHKSDK